MRIFLTVFKFEPLGKQTRWNSPGASCPHGFAFQGSFAAAGADAKDRVGSWVIPGSVGYLHRAWQSRTWREGKSFHSMGGKTLAQLIAQGGGGWLIPAASKVSFQLVSNYCPPKPVLV